MLRRYLHLNILNPASLLNDIAYRYASLPRVVMEYVDNSLDEHQDIAHSGTPSRNTKVSVLIDPKHRAMLVHDNCRGISSSKLRDMVTTVGTSGKKEAHWMNGRFGFGIHSFRAVATHIAIMSQGELLRIDKHSQDVSEPTEISSTLGGTQVLISGLDSHFSRDLDVEKIASEIETHFERILDDKNISVSVGYANLQPWVNFVQAPSDTKSLAISESTRQCESFDYSQVEGSLFKKTFTLSNGEQMHMCLTIAAKEYGSRKARFFSLGRRIEEIQGTNSFIRNSGRRTSVWAHPQLLGYVELPPSVELVITRDEFKPSKYRDEVYEHMLSVEDKLQKSLDTQLETFREKSLVGFGEILSKSLEPLARKESKMNELRPLGLVIEPPRSRNPTSRKPRAPKDTSDSTDPSKEGKTSKDTRLEPSMFGMRFCQIPASEEHLMKRSQMIDSTIEINTLHPDFKRRFRTRKGKPVFNERLSGYISTLIASHYREFMYESRAMDPDRGRIFDDLIGTYAHLESRIRTLLMSSYSVEDDEIEIK